MRFMCAVWVTDSRLRGTSAYLRPYCKSAWTGSKATFWPTPQHSSRAVALLRNRRARASNRHRSARWRAQMVRSEVHAMDFDSIAGRPVTQQVIAYTFFHVQAMHLQCPYEVLARLSWIDDGLRFVELGEPPRRGIALDFGFEFFEPLWIVLIAYAVKHVHRH